jgi:hypothetical protein
MGPDPPKALDRESALPHTDSIVMIVGTDGHARATGKILKRTDAYCLVECDRFSVAKTGETVLLVLESDPVGTGQQVRVKLTAGRRLTLELSPGCALGQVERVETRFHGRGSVASVSTPNGPVRITVLGVGSTGFEFKAPTTLPVKRELTLTVLVKGQYQDIKGQVTELVRVSDSEYRGIVALSFHSRLDRRLWATALECAGHECA